MSVRDARQAAVVFSLFLCDVNHLKKTGQVQRIRFETGAARWHHVQLTGFLPFLALQFVSNAHGFTPARNGINISRYGPLCCTYTRSTPTPFHVITSVPH
jgi:hypothetical protein